MRIFRKLAQMLDVNVASVADGDALVYDLATGKWIPGAGGGGGAPTDVDYLVGTASGSLSAEIAVGTTPGGELSGTWASPTVDATHSGSSHASVQAAAEATAASALSSHASDTTGIHGIADTSALETSAGAQAKVDTHVNDTSAAHAASAIGNTPAGNIAATDVQAALNELDTEKAAAASAVMDGDSAGGVLSGTYPNPGFASDMATQAELDAHLNDTSDAHDASAISVADSGNNYTATDVEGVLAEIAPQLGGGGSPTGSAGGALDGSYPNPGLAASVAGSGLTETSDVLSVNVDGSTLEINADTLRIKDGGVTAAKVAADVATQAELDAHINDTSAAHAASAISIADAGGYLTGTDVEAALQEILAGVFAQTNYTPALTASVTNPTLGSGSSANGRYMRIGNLVIAWGVIIFGTSGVNPGSGNYRISLPVTASINLGSMRIGQIIINDSSTSANFTVGSAIVIDGEETYFYMQRTGSSSLVSNSSPITWAASDDVSWVIVYPAG